MISLRRHVLTLVAVFLALALGVVLGTTSVATWVRDALSSEGERTSAQLARATEELQSARGDADRLDGMAGTLEPAVTRGILDKRPILVVISADAPGDLVTAAIDAIRAAGGYESGRVILADKSVNPAAEPELQTVLSNLPLGAGAPGADRDLGTQLGHALGRGALLRPADAKPLAADGDRETILASLKKTGFVDYDPGSVRPGQLALLVTGRNGGADGIVATRLAAIAREIDVLGAGAVLAAQVPSEAEPNAVSALRALPAGASTVDDLAYRSGRLAVVLALAEQLRGQSGQYGLRHDAAAVLPEIPARG